jgi:hypothetical protein
LHDEVFECSGIITVDHTEPVKVIEADIRCVVSVTTVYDETQLDSLCLRLAVASDNTTLLYTSL